jgi:hypothetical protein
VVRGEEIREKVFSVGRVVYYGKDYFVDVGEFERKRLRCRKKLGVI